MNNIKIKIKNKATKLKNKLRKIRQEAIPLEEIV